MTWEEALELDRKAFHAYKSRRPKEEVILAMTVCSDAWLELGQPSLAYPPMLYIALLEGKPQPPFPSVSEDAR